MKKVMRLVLIVVISVLFASGCKDKADEKDPAQDTKPEVTDVAEEGTSDAQENIDEPDQSGADGGSVLSTDDKSVSITIIRPEGYESPRSEERRVGKECRL